MDLEEVVLGCGDDDDDGPLIVLAPVCARSECERKVVGG